MKTVIYQVHGLLDHRVDRWSVLGTSYPKFVDGARVILTMNLPQLSTQMEPDIEKGAEVELYSAGTATTLTPSCLEEGRSSSSRSAGVATAEGEGEGQRVFDSLICYRYG
jgi:hypothetical protein